MKTLQNAENSYSFRISSLFNKYRYPKYVRTIFMLVLCFLTAYPFLWMLIASFTQENQVFSYPLRWIPNPINLKSYKNVLWTSKGSALPFMLGLPFSTYYLNSIKVTFITMVGTLFSTTLAAYAYTKINFKWRDKLFLLQLATMMLPPQVSMLPNFIIFRNLGLVNTHAALWIPSLLGDAFTIFLLRQFLITIPMELNESAYIDGAGHFTIYSRIILPLSKPILATVMIFTFIGSWNNYEGPLIYIRSAKLYTIPIALQAMATNTEAIHNAELMAATVLSVIPVLIIFGAFQRYFVESISATGIKG